MSDPSVVRCKLCGEHNEGHLHTFQEVLDYFGFTEDDLVMPNEAEVER